MKIVQILEPAVGQGKVRPQVSVSDELPAGRRNDRAIRSAGIGCSKPAETGRANAGNSAGWRHSGPERSRQCGEAATIDAAEHANGAGGATGTPPDRQAGNARAARCTAAAVDNIATKQSETINYEVSKAVRHTWNPVGKTESRVGRRHYRQPDEDDNRSGRQTADEHPEPRNADEMKKYRDIVAAAIGFNPDRGDHLTVENVSFDGESGLVETPTFLQKQGPVIINEPSLSDRSRRFHPDSICSSCVRCRKSFSQSRNGGAAGGVRFRRAIGESASADATYGRLRRR